MPGARWRKLVRIGCDSIAALTLPGKWKRVKRGAPGKSPPSASSTFSPPRMPVSQSCTSATRGRGGTGAGMGNGLDAVGAITSCFPSLLSCDHRLVDVQRLPRRLVPAELLGAASPELAVGGAALGAAHQMGDRLRHPVEVERIDQRRVPFRDLLEGRGVGGD